MKPNFALDLTHDSVSLLHRTPNGWLFVGKVLLDADNLAGEIAFWRGTAQTLAPHGVTSKLVIPNSEVLYRRLNAPGPDDKSRDAQIRAQIDGLTPYALDELVFDWVVAADRSSVDVAVVARETLAEAEAFAVTHKLNPVSFVAKPDAADFSAEPFFGATRAAAQILGKGVIPERETSTIAVTGKAVITAKSAASDIAPKPWVAEKSSPGPATPTGDAKAPAASGAAVAKGGAFSSIAAKIAQSVRPATSGPVPAAPDAAPVNKPAAAAASVPTSVDAKSAQAAAISQPTPKPETARGGSAEPTSVSASRSGGSDAPVVAFRSGRSGNVDKILVPPKRAEQPSSRLQLPEPSTSTSGGLAGRATALLKGKKASDTPTPNPEAAAVKPAAADKPQTTPAKTPVPEPKAPVARPVATPAPVDKAAAAPVLAPVAASAAETPEPPAKPELQPDARKAEAEAMTVFGARRTAQDDTGFMKRGVLLTVGLLLILAAVALASVFLTNASDPDPEVATQTDVAPAPVAPPEPLTLTQDDALPVDELIAAPDAVAEGEGTAPVAESVEDAPVEAPEDALPETVIAEQEAEADTPSSLSDSDVAVREALGLTPEASTSDAEVAADPAEPAPPAALATGDVQVGPQGANPPEADQGGFSLSPTTAPALADLIAGLPTLSPPSALPSLPPPSLAPPAPFGTEFDLGPDGLVIPTPEGALTPQGVRVHSGSPGVTPPPRPEVPASFTPVVPAETEDAAEPEQQGALPTLDDALQPGADPALAVLRPRTRPVTEAAEPTEAVETAASSTAPADADTAQAEAATADAPEPQVVASPGGLALTALSGVRPAARPSDLVAGAGSIASPAATPDTDALVAAEVVSDNPLAVAASRRPNNRPSDFSDRVQAAIAAAQRAPAAASAPVQQASASAAATPRPSIPSSASVAEQATQTRAINLRRVNLLGVFGTANNRAALVRLSNGNVVRVSVGDRLDGGQVSSISDTELRYVKSGRNQVLTIGSSS